MRHLPALLLALALASCVAPKPAPRALPAAPRPAPALPAAPPQSDWRDVPLTPGTWTWRGAPGQRSLAQFGVPGAPAVFAVRCDVASRTVVLSRGGAGAATLRFTTSFASFALPGAAAAGDPPAIAAALPARDPRLDQLAFSRGRFLVDTDGLPRLVLPAWPEVARVIEDCRS